MPFFSSDIYMSNCIYIHDLYGSYTILWEFSIIYVTGILGVNVFAVITRLPSCKSDILLQIRGKLTKWKLYAIKLTIGTKNVSSVVNAWKSYIDKRLSLSPKITRVACYVCLIQRKFLKSNVCCKRKKMRSVYS